MKKEKRYGASAFEKIQAGLQDAIAYHRDGKKLTISEVVLPEPAPRARAKDVIAIRQSLGVSQSVFAGLLNVSAKTVQAWEIGSRRPSDVALRLLQIAKTHPEVLMDTLGRKVA